MNEYNGVGAGQGRDPRDVSHDGVVAGSLGVFILLAGAIVLTSWAVKLVRENFPF